jgi:opacity protein-like surface antigen
MRHPKKHILLFIFLVSTSVVDAQLSSGYVFGVNFSTLNLQTKGTCSNLETKGGINLGLFLEVPLTRRFSFQPKLLFSAKGTDFKIDTVKYSLSPVYLEIPLNVGFRMGNISLFAGPYLAIGIGGLKMDLKGNLRDISFGTGENKDMKAFDAGFNVGLGVNIKGILISAQYGIGLTNISPWKATYPEMQNRVLSVSIVRYGGEN